ncbi:MAG: DNA-binding protein [Bacteriovoracaceae bacterium]|jgi:hypothetical protein|nr:DNA-binding protein [Bacteriovoracaceae bacterium]
MNMSSLKSVFLLLVIVFSSTLYAFPRDKVAKKAGKIDPKLLHKGVVVETMNSGGYTYVLIDNKKEKLWTAATKVSLQKGDQVEFIKGNPMVNFTSKTLGRTFKKIYFTSFIQLQKKAGGVSSKVKMGSIKKAQYLVSEIHTKRKKLVNKTVQVRGKVVKFSPKIMKLNWVHVQDGSGKNGSHDLTVTTNDTVKVGDTIVVSGKVVIDKDFGYNYKYSTLLQEAKLTVE